MLKQKTYQVFSISMALWLLVVSVGFTASEHYCQGDLKNLSWFGEAPSCHDMEAMPSCHDTKEKKPCKKGVCTSEKSAEKPCCENETVFFQMDADYSHFQSYVSSEYEQPIAVLAYGNVHELFKHINVKSNFNLYKPPNHSNAHRVLTQSFLL